ncbi:MATE efflux family protein [Raphanus sativus]|uniref:Protein DETOXIFICATION n=1 Tax=Raphanus sativus TaxID=3726 RepID=A0A6J0L8F3_RAPSA|nr:protein DETOXIFICATION 50-like [Raphanus sativus]KAJ4875768.1 MATE efflux family protein [Raphanus sativus]
MSLSNCVSDEVKTPFLPKHSHHERLHYLKSFFALLSLFAREAISIVRIAYPLIITNGLLHFRSFISMFFLAGLGGPTLAGGSLALAFANITAYSLFSGLTMGVDSICSQAIGATRYKLFRATIHRGIILLLVTTLPVFLLWINIERILTMLKQDEELASTAHTFLLYSVPDLIAQSFLHPLRAYFRTQSKTLPLSICTGIASVLHFPITFLLVSYLGCGIKGIALSGVLSNFNLVAFLFIYIAFFEDNLRKDEKVSEESYEDSVREWKKLLGLAVPSCVAVCLEWWCYEIMIVLCGLLINPKVAVASMGILIQITSLVYIFPHSLGSAVSTRVGNELGSNQPQRARRATFVGLGLSIALAFMAFIFTFSVRKVWATFFTDDEKVVNFTVMVLPIVGLCELGNCPQTVGCGVLRGSARPRMGAKINIAAFYVIGLPGGMVLAFWFGFGFMGLWLGMLAAQISCMIGMMVATCKTNWAFEAARARELTAPDDVRNCSHVEDVEVGKLIIREE